MSAVISLRKLCYDDKDWIYSACQDPEIQKWTTMPAPCSMADAIDYVENNSDYDYETWVILKDDFPIGTISQHGFLDHEDHGEVYTVGYWITKSERGNGYGRKALELLYELLEPKKYCFQLEISPGNTPSIKAALAAGFYVIGSRRGLFVYSK